MRRSPCTRASRQAPNAKASGPSRSSGCQASPTTSRRPAARSPWSSSSGGERLPLCEVVREDELGTASFLLPQPREGLALALRVVGVRRERVEVEGEAAVAGVADEDRLALDDERLVARGVPGGDDRAQHAVAEDVVLAVEELDVMADVEVRRVVHAELDE